MAVSASTILGILLIAAAGSGLVWQNGMNATLGQKSGSSSFASLISFSTAVVLMVGYFVVETYALGVKLPSVTALQGAPWWSWVGGALGAFYVCSAVIFSQKLGAGTLTAVSVTAQLITAIALDGLGLVGFHKRKVHWARLVGAVLLIAGTVLITRFRGDLVHDSALPLVNENVLQVKDSSTGGRPAVELSVSPAVH